MNNREKRTVDGWLLGSFLATLLGLLAACVPAIHIREVSIDSQNSPSSFPTYRWDETVLRHEKIEESIDPSFNSLIRETVDDVLLAKGYGVSDGAAAMILSIQLTVDEEVEVFPAFNTTDPQDETLSYGLLWRQTKGGSPVNLGRLSPDEQVTYLAEGTLHIAAFNPQKAPVWHVMGHKILELDHSPEMHRKTLRETVLKIMRRFPDLETSSLD